MDRFAVAHRPIDQDEYRSFRVFLEQATGIVLGEGKEYLVSSRLGSVLREHGLASLGELIRALQGGGGMRLRTSVVDAMTTNETFWFRDISHFRLLTDRVLREAGGRPGPVRIWSAACSSGQEPYSISMAVQEFQARNPGRLPGGVEILATDISSRVLAQARAGEYCGTAVSRGLDDAQRRQFFLPRGECLEVRPEIRRRVEFRELNLSGSFALLGRFDAIFCRNVLIYFSGDTKAGIIDRLSRALNPGGYLFLGSTESLSGHSDRFEMITGHAGIVYRLKGR